MESLGRFRMTLLYVGNLSFGAREEDLRAAFAPHGEIASIHIASQRNSGRSLGFAFVEMQDEAAARGAARALNNTVIADRPIRISEARPPHAVARIANHA